MKRYRDELAREQDSRRQLEAQAASSEKRDIKEAASAILICEQSIRNKVAVLLRFVTEYRSASTKLSELEKSYLTARITNSVYLVLDFRFPRRQKSSKPWRM